MPEKNETPTLAQMAEALRTERDTLAAQIKSQNEFFAGDYVGHPFHGNQYVGGETSTKANTASHTAHEKSKEANDSKGHHAAAKAHAEASKQQEIAGNGSAAAYHDAMAKYHESEAKHSAASEHGKSKGAKAETIEGMFDEIATTRDSALAELADAKAKLAGPQFDAAKSAAATSTPPPASARAQAADSAKPKTQAELEKAYADLPNDPVLRAKWRKEHLKD